MIIKVQLGPISRDQCIKLEYLFVLKRIYVKNEHTHIRIHINSKYAFHNRCSVVSRSSKI